MSENQWGKFQDCALETHMSLKTRPTMAKKYFHAFFHTVKSAVVKFQLKANSDIVQLIKLTLHFTLEIIHKPCGHDI